jgi:hypothetical protein
MKTYTGAGLYSDWVPAPHRKMAALVTLTVKNEHGQYFAHEVIYHHAVTVPAERC